MVIKYTRRNVLYAHQINRIQTAHIKVNIGLGQKNVNTTQGTNTFFFKLIHLFFRNTSFFTPLPRQRKKLIQYQFDQIAVQLICSNNLNKKTKMFYRKI